MAAEARAQQGLAPAEPLPAQPAPVQTHVIAVAAPPAAPNPAGVLLAVVVGSFVVGLLARRRAESVSAPTTRIREGLADLGGQATEGLVDLLQRTRAEIARRVG